MSDVVNQLGARPRRVLRNLFGELEEPALLELTAAGEYDDEQVQDVADKVDELAGLLITIVEKLKDAGLAS